MSVPRHPVELTPPDITAYAAGNTGINYLSSFESSRPGPHAMITAVVHGNELCGAIALDFLLREAIRPRCGRLSLGFVNTDAYHAFDARDPTVSRFVDEDMNRVWAPAVLDGARDSIELRRARALRPFVDTVDVLLDLHSMQHDAPALALAGPLEKGHRLATAIGVPEYVVRDRGHAAGVRLRDYDGFARPADPRVALLVECGQHWKHATAAMAIEAALRFLHHLGLLAPECAARHLPDAPPPQRFVTVTEAVTIKAERFVFADAFRGLEVIPKAGTLIGHDGDRPVLTPYDECVLVMPSHRLTRGLTAVRLGRLEP